MRGQLMDSLYLEDSPIEYFVMDFISLPKRRRRYFEEVVQQEIAPTYNCELSTPNNDDDDQAWRDLLLYSTGCWRNYVATWRIVGKQLYLADIWGRFKLIQQPLHAVWVSQTTRIRKEECVFDALNDENTFDFKLHFQNGVLVALTGHDDQSVLTTPSTAVQ